MALDPSNSTNLEQMALKGLTGIVIAHGRHQDHTSSLYNKLSIGVTTEIELRKLVTDITLDQHLHSRLHNSDPPLYVHNA